MVQVGGLGVRTVATCKSLGCPVIKAGKVGEVFGVGVRSVATCESLG